VIVLPRRFGRDIFDRRDVLRETEEDSDELCIGDVSKDLELLL
jgi:hypothetical protein